MVMFVHHPSDALLAERVRSDLQSAGHPLSDSPSQRNALLVILSPAALSDSAVQRAIETAIDQRQHILPVLAKPTTLPNLIGNLIPLDFSAVYDREQLLERVNSFNQGVTMKTLTPRQRMHNRNIGLLITFIVVFMFFTGLFAVMGRATGLPTDEYNTVETMIAATNYVQVLPVIEPLVPRSTDDAANFPSTAQAVSTRYREYLIGTATAVAPRPR